MKILKRNILVDCLKGYACLLVTFGHVIMGIRKTNLILVPDLFQFLEKFLWTYHVPLFMFLSGFIYNVKGGWKVQGNRKEFILKKFINLGIPYFSFSIVYIVLNSMIKSVNNRSNFLDILYLWEKPVAQYWFLYSLFFCFLYWTFFSKFMNSKCIFIFLSLGKYLLKNFNLGIIASGIGSSFSFGLGTIISNIEFKLKKWIKILIVLIHIIVVTISIKLDIKHIFGIKELQQILGIFGSIMFISILIENMKIKEFLLKINKYSFAIYLLHTIFTSAIRIILIRISLNEYYLHIILGSIFGIICPSLIYKISEKFKILNFFFCPSRYLKKVGKNND